MRAALYARTSTPSLASIEAQLENARAFANARGWTVVEECADEAVSGADSKRLLARARLIERAAAGSIDVVVMREASRFSRLYGDEAFKELKALVQSGVAVWFYDDSTSFTFGDFESNIVGLLRAEMNAEYRRHASLVTKEAMVRKAAQGHVTGGRVFGYDNVTILRPDGERSHVERRINDAEAAIVRRIYEMYAAGDGQKTIAKTLNDERVPTPRAQRNRPDGWAPSSVREVLRRPLYRGEIVWNRTAKRDRSGQQRQTKRTRGEWMRMPADHLRIVSEDLAARVDARLANMHDRMLRTSGGRLHGRPLGEGAKYLLTGLLRCGTCGGGFEALSRPHGRRPGMVYGCATRRRKGTSACSNGRFIEMKAADVAVARIGGVSTSTPRHALMAALGGWPTLHWSEEGFRIEVVQTWKRTA